MNHILNELYLYAKNTATLKWEKCKLMKKNPLICYFTFEIKTAIKVVWQKIVKDK